MFIGGGPGFDAKPAAIHFYVSDVDDVYARAHAQFSDEELAKLTLGVTSINAWNRFNIAFRTPAGSYQPAHKK